MEIGKFKLAKADLVRPPNRPNQEQIIPKQKPYTEKVFKLEVDDFIKGFIGGFPKDEMLLKIQSVLDKAVDAGAVEPEQGIKYLRERKQQLLDFARENYGQELPGIEEDRKDFAIGGGNFYGTDLGTREGFSQYIGDRGKNRPKFTSITNQKGLEKNIKKLYNEGFGADKIIKDLNLEISPTTINDFINDRKEKGIFKEREAVRTADTYKQPGKESKKFMDYIENIIDQNPGKYNMFQNKGVAEIVKDSGADIKKDNANRILTKIYNLGSKGSKLEKFYPDIEKRAVELIDSGMGTPDITNTLIEEGLIEKQLDNQNKTNYKPTKAYLQRLIDDGKTKIKKLTAQPGDTVDITTRNYRDDAIKNLLDNQSSSITTNRISTIVSEELGETVSPQYIKSFFKRNNIDIDKYIKSTSQRIFPEIKALDKIVKKNIKYLTDPDVTFVDKGNFLSNEYTKTLNKSKSQTITGNEAGTRLKKLLSIYAGTDQRYNADLYNQIKPLKNYTDPQIQKNLIGLTSNLSRASNVDVARMLGLPKKDIELLQNLQKATSQLGDFKIAGDHTDIKAIMSDFPNYKKNFMKIQYVSNDLNTLKSTYDKKIIALYNSAKAGAAPETIVSKLEEIQNDFKTKTGYDIGGFSFKKNGKIAIDPQTVAVNEYRYPINDNVIKTMGNIEAYENKKYTNPLDKEVMGAQGSPNKLKAIYEKYKGNVKVINNSKYVKGLDNVPKLKGFKNALLYGGAGTAAIFATAANADTNDDMFAPVDPGVIVPQETKKESLPAEAAFPLSLVMGKYAKPFLKGTVKTIGSLPAAGTLAYMDIKQGMNEGQSFVDAATDPTVGLELLYPELFKGAGPLMTKAARVSTPVGAGITVGGTLKNRAKEMMKQAEGITALDEGEEQRRLIEEYAAKNYRGYNQGGRVNFKNGTEVPVITIDDKIDEMISFYQDYLKQGGKMDFVTFSKQYIPENFAAGGRVGFADGPEDPSKRKLMKIMGGLASIPILGRFFDIAQVAEKTAPAAVEAIKNAPPHFLGLVNKIRALGKVFPGSKERSEVYRYDDYEMDIDYDTGTIDITKNKEGMFEDEIAPMEQVKMTYSPGVADKTTGGKVADQYDEYTVRPDDEGKMKDVEDGVPDDVIDEGSISKEELEQLIIENIKKGEK